MMTSYWAVGGSMLTNIVDMFKLKDEKDTKTRLIAIACTVLPPFILAYAGLVSFVDAIGWAGTFGGVIMSIVPVLMLNNARKKGDIEPEWKCGWYAHPAVQGMIIVIFSLAAIYFICSMIGILPAGWEGKGRTDVMRVIPKDKVIFHFNPTIPQTIPSRTERPSGSSATTAIAVRSPTKASSARILTSASWTAP